MAEAAILGMIKDLESSHVTCTNIKWRFKLEAKIKELREMLDFLSDWKMEERSTLKYLMADLVEMAQDVVDMDIERLFFNNMFNTLQNEIKMTKIRMINFGADEKNVGGGEEEEVVVGLEEDVRELLHKVILNELYSYHVWTIKGMIGIGKTTLARQVYNHKDVVGQFERRGWVSFSNDMSYKEVLVELIQQMVVGSDELIEKDSLLEEKDNRSLRQMLRHHLQGKRFFIVVDNLLKGMQLNYILQDLQEKDGDHGSRLLCTSRYDSQDSGPYNTHNMKPLDSDKSWHLFLNTIFRGDKFTSDEKKFSKDLERKGREMLKKCGGLPVAIIDVGRQKAKQRLSGIEWEELFDSIDLGESLKLLEPMYHQLDEKLKACFLHMSFFKENAIMREEKLEQIWAASGLRPRKYLTYELFRQSIIEVLHEFPRLYEVKWCRINPLLHMLSIKKAEEKMGFVILRSNGNNRPSQSARHRVIHCGRDKFNHSTNQDKNLVSLIFHGGGRYLDDASQSYWKSFEFLKILDMEDFGVKTLSETIGTLIELRYLGLRNNYMEKIPHSLGGLKKLEVLDIDLNFMVEVPDIIWEMDSLRHLYMSNVICQKPLKVDTLQDLETLTYISVYDWTYEVSGLEMMTRLRKLGIEEVDENSDVGKLFASLAKLKCLYHLILRGFRFRGMPCLDEIGVLDRLRELRLDGRLSRLPSANNFPQKINYLTLVNTCLDEDPMPVLEKLPCLWHLKLRNAYTGREMVIQHGGFPELNVLRLNELWNLRKVQVGEGAMSRLSELQINNCPHLETPKQEIGSMKYLRKLKMVTTKHIATKIRISGLTSKILEMGISP